MDPKNLPKVLYIEDTPDARALVSRVLGQDFIVLEAADPLSGIELAIETEPDLILLDINLPHLSGREVAARLKRLLPDATLVAFTADASPGARDRALAAGCVGYLTKPLDVDTFSEQISEFLMGKREELHDRARHERAFQDELVERLEGKVRELTKTSERNAFLNEQNQHLIAALQRRQHLLEAAARVGRIITSILDLDELLRVTVDVICEEYDFVDFVGVFLAEPSGEWASLRAGSGPHGPAMLAANYRLPMDGFSTVSKAILEHKAQIILDVSQHEGYIANPFLTKTSSEMALPLVVKNQGLGALVVQNEQTSTFQDDDITALQTLADNVATAIDNALLLLDLKRANQELLRNKTYEAIATTTGETIHWVANKAAPIPESARRVRQDLGRLVCLFNALLKEPPEQRPNHPLWAEAQEIFATLARAGLADETPTTPFPGSLESILEDLAIIEQGATNILDVKEDLMGPVRLQHRQSIELTALLDQTIFEMGLPAGVIETRYAANLPALDGDVKQLGQVFNNLIKNAWEALEKTPQPAIRVIAMPAKEPGFVQIEIQDNGPGIPPELLDKIWVSFFTTKGDRGGTGLGLSACMAIISQHNGKINVESQVGVGTTFTLLLPTLDEISTSQA